jgi:hypothetical protein
MPIRVATSSIRKPAAPFLVGIINHYIDLIAKALINQDFPNISSRIYDTFTTFASQTMIFDNKHFTSLYIIAYFFHNVNKIKA